MSLSPEAIDALVAAGVTAEQLGAAMKAELAAAEAKKAAKRAGNAERQRRKRERDAGEVTLVTRDSALHGVTARDTPSPPSSPPTPPLTTPPPPGVLLHGRETAFAGFWSAYPRKVGKRNAETAYRLACKRLGGADPPGVILAGLRAQLAGWQLREPDLIPHASTWLNRDGWEDEPDAPRAARNQRTNGHGYEQPSLGGFSENLERAFRGSQIAVDAGRRYERDE